MSFQFQTILEQQRVIRRLLRKSVSDNVVVASHGSNKNSDERDSCFNSDPEQEDESEQGSSSFIHVMQD